MSSRYCATGKTWRFGGDL